LGLIAPAAHAQEASFVSIPAQPMSSALQQLARQTGVNILFLPGVVRSLRSAATSGRLTPEEAARRLVAGSGLRISRDAMGGLIVRPEPPPPGRARSRAPAPAPAAPTPPVAVVEEATILPALLEEIVVTATRRPDIVSRVPLSISAETQRGLDQRGLRSMQDFEATVPAFRITAATGQGAAIVAIRGIVQAGPTAATTGFYIDDVPIQRRSGGSAGGANGTPQPALFDLERIEILRGPQGTLFGSGSEGGTIRLIQTQPSLTRVGAYVRAQVSSIHHGETSRELGVAVGGPIVKDRLGFRASAFQRRNGGYIDLVDPFTGKVWLPDANRSTQQSARLALTWAPTERLHLTASFLTSHSESRHTSGRMTVPIADQIVVPALCFDNRDIESLPVTSPRRQTPVPIGFGEAECAAARAAGGVTHETPGFTLGPYPLGPYQSIENDVFQAQSNLNAYTLDLAYEGPGFDVKSITSYVQDSLKQNTPQPFQVNRVRMAVNLDPNDPRNARVGTLVIPSGIPFYPYFGPEGFRGPAHFTSTNPRYTFNQEVRLSSQPSGARLGWVLGGFYSNSRIKPNIKLFSESNDYSLAQFGITDAQRYGIRSLESSPGVYNIFGRVQETLKDEELAVFGEANYWLLDRLKLIAGLRVSRIRFSYKHSEIGPSNAVIEPTLENRGASIGSVAETPVTPRLGAQYFLGEDSSVYVIAAKGYRGGGINTPIAQAQAGDSLARNFGAAYTVADLPRVYTSDRVWSYEAGAKLRFGDVAQLNAGVYWIDWRDPQTPTPIPQTGASVTTNARGARSLGVEIEGQAALGRDLTLVAALGLNQAEYTERSVAFTGANGVEAVSTLPGQRIPSPPVTVSLGARRNFIGPGGLASYVRGDWRYSAGYRLAPFGSAAWTPDANKVPLTSVLNLRAGVEIGGVDVNLFVNNLFERRKGAVNGGRQGCPLQSAGGTEACAVYFGFEPFRYTNWGTPREVGVQIAFRR
jgi:outer membrane receptor protein involved in Fe transport